jgi:hypothetical protein
MRSYDVPDGYENRLPYLASLNIQWNTPEIVFLSALNGAKVDMETWNEAMKALKELGVTTVMYERHGQGKVKTKYL